MIDTIIKEKTGMSFNYIRKFLKTKINVKRGNMFTDRKCHI